MSCRQVQNSYTREDYYGKYWNCVGIDDGKVLKINKDNSFEFSYWLGGIEVRGKVIFKNNKALLILSAHKEMYEFKEIRNRADGSTFVYCFSGSYDEKDESSSFRLLDKKDKQINGIHTDNFSPVPYLNFTTMTFIDSSFSADTNEVLKLWLGDYDKIYLDVVASGDAAFGMPFGIEIKERTKNGKDYYLWITDDLPHMFNISIDMEVEKESDSTIILKYDSTGLRFLRIKNKKECK